MLCNHGGRYAWELLGSARAQAHSGLPVRAVAPRVSFEVACEPSARSDLGDWAPRLYDSTIGPILLPRPKENKIKIKYKSIK